MENIIQILVPVAMAVVVIVLGLGLYSLFKGGETSRNWSNKLMRLRVLVQFIAIVLVMLGFYLSSQD
jgi:heme/copper-type cytochrome/quinol oxidase subunit 2